MKARIFAILLFCFCGVALFALPKVAVLDAVLPAGMDPNISIGVTEKISEELVSSGKYTVLDRTTVGQSLKEIEFQMSGLVSDADIQKAGQQLNSRLGATFVVVARVSKVENTFFITAKLIDIQTGEITAQASYQAEGGPAVTFQIAQVVGKKLAIGARESTQVAVEPDQTTATTGGNKTPPAGGTTQPPAQPGAVTFQPRLIAEYMIPSFVGNLINVLNTSGQKTSTDVFTDTGWNIHYLQPLFLGIYVSVYGSGISETIDWVDNYVNLHNNYFDAYDFGVGVGWGFALFQGFQIYAGVTAGYYMLTLSNYWSDAAIYVLDPVNYYDGANWGGICYGAEVGVDWILFGFLPVSARISYSSTSFDTSNTGATDVADYMGVSIGAGIAW
jgi:TolB-like protein